MADLLKSDRIKIDILIHLYKNGKMTPSMLSRSVGAKYETIVKGLLFLEEIKLVSSETVKHGEKNYRFYTLTAAGKRISEGLAVGG